MTKAMQAWRNKHNYLILCGIVFPAETGATNLNTTPAMPSPFCRSPFQP
jgi:hypothetical protein